jgi:hypothetical protein
VGTVEQVVDVRFEPQGDSLIAVLDVPASALAAVNGPAVPGDTTSVASTEADLALVARSLGYDLDVWQSGEPLPAASAQGLTSADGSRFYARLAYAFRPGARDISARLNTVVGPVVLPVRTRVTYLLRTGAEQVLALQGAPTRVSFDPGPFDALRDFLVRALNTLFAGGDHLLFLGCLLLPALRPREAATLLGAVAVGQGATMIATLLFPLGAAVAVPLGMIGTSAIVIAGIQAVAGARFRWRLPVAVVFGLGNGFVLGSAFRAAEPFAGSHLWIAATIFVVAFLVGQFWLGAVAWLARDWLGNLGAFPRLVVLLASVVLIHSALHRVVEAGRGLAGVTGEASPVAVWMTLGWVAACVLVGFANGPREHLDTGALAGGGRG